MKAKMIVVSLLAISLAATPKAKGQLRINFQINVGDQPAWRLPGYDYVEYYFLPDIDCYYYVPQHQFVYLSNGRWVFSASLPVRYRDYDLYNGYKVVINRHNAYRNYIQDRERYWKPRDNHHDNWDNHHDNGRHNGWNKHHEHEDRD